jgi:hypothetical protein
VFSFAGLVTSFDGDSLGGTMHDDNPVARLKGSRSIRLFCLLLAIAI